MNWLDYVLILAVAVSIAEGFSKGFIRLGIGFIATVIAFILAAWFYGTAAGWLTPMVKSAAAARVLGFGLIFAGVMVVGAIVSTVLARLFRLVGLGFVDRAGGAVLGGVRGVLLCVIAIVAMLAFMTTTPKPIVESRLAPYLAGTAQTLANLTPYEIRNGVRMQYEDLKRIWADVLKKPGKKLPAEEI